MDNDHATWAAFKNRYWLRKYLIDIDGYLVYDRAGEGAYKEIEQKIRELLFERMLRLNVQDSVSMGMVEVNACAVDFSQIIKSEIYLGYEFTRGNFGNIQGLSKEKQVMCVSRGSN